MGLLLSVSGAIDRLLERIARAAGWLFLAGVLTAQEPTGSASAWTHDFAAAQRLARAEPPRDLLLFFTGSDWCGWCKKLKADVPVHITHMKPGYEGALLREINALGDSRIRPLHHHPVVIGQKWLALGTVHQDVINPLTFGNRVFGVGRERRATHTDYAGQLDFGNKLLRRQMAPVASGVRLLLAVVRVGFDYDRSREHTTRIATVVYCPHPACRRAVQIGGDKSPGFSDQLTSDYPFSWLDHRFALRAELLIQRHHIFVYERHALNRQRYRRFFVFARMHAVRETVLDQF